MQKIKNKKPEKCNKQILLNIETDKAKTGKYHESEYRKTES